MGIIDKWLTGRGYVKVGPGKQYPQWGLERAGVEAMSFPQYVDNENKITYFERVSWVNIAVDKVATVGSAAGWNVKKANGEDMIDIPNHPFEQVLKAPNPTMSRSDLIYATLAYMSVCNSAYWWVNYGLGGLPAELWLIPTKQISPIPDGNMFIKHYEYDPGDGRLIKLDPKEIVAFNGFNPESMFVGMSNLDPLRTIMDSDIGMQNWNKKLFVKSNGRLPGILAFADPIPDEDWQLIQGDVDRAASMRNFMMLRNVKAGGVQWLQATASQKDMEFLNSRLANRDEIYSAIAPGLASMLSVNATEANARIGKTTLIDFKVYPLLRKIGDVVTTNIMPLYGEGYVLEPEDIRVTDKVLMMAEMAEYSRTHTVDEVRAKYWQDKPLENQAIGSVLVSAAQNVNAYPAEEKEPEEVVPIQLPEEVGNPMVDIEAEEDVKAKDYYPAFVELDKWERKQKKAGKAVEFIAYNIPAEIADAIKAGTMTFEQAREKLTYRPVKRDEPRNDTDALLALADAINRASEKVTSEPVSAE